MESGSKPTAGFDRTALLAVLEQALEDLARETVPARRPTKDDLLAYLKSGAKKLNLYFIRHLPRRQWLCCAGTRL